MSYFFTSESVSEGHPDKVCDQISDAILDDILKHDPTARVACETFCATGLVLVGGEITTKHYVDVPKVVRKVVQEIGYTKGEYRFDYHSINVMSAIKLMAAMAVVVHHTSYQMLLKERCQNLNLI